MSLQDVLSWYLIVYLKQRIQYTLEDFELLFIA